MSIRLACLAAVLATLATPTLAQDSLPMPALSPAMSLSHTLGMTRIDLAYSAPSVRDRTIFGAKVPYDVVWRAGANATTKITFSSDIMVEGEALPAGSYGIHMKPGTDRWTVYFNSQADAWGSYDYDPANDVAVVDVEPRAATHREQLRYAFEDVTAEVATLVLHWAEVEVPVRMQVDVSPMVLAQVRAAAERNDQSPGWAYWDEAAEYGRNHGISDEEAMDWIERSVARKRTFINLFMLSEMLEAADKQAQAKEIKAEALELGDVEQLGKLAFRYHQRGDFQRSAKVFGMVIAQGGANWWPHTMLAEARRELGDTKGAAEALRGALKANPDPVTRSEIEAGIAKLEETGD